MLRTTLQTWTAQTIWVPASSKGDPQSPFGPIPFPQMLSLSWARAPMRGWSLIQALGGPPHSKLSLHSMPQPASSTRLLGGLSPKQILF